MEFGESRVQHYCKKQTRHWEFDGNVVTELDEYKNLGVLKNYTSSSRLDISEAIEKTRKKAGMLLNGCTDGRKTNPILNCGPKSVFQPYYNGAELWTLKFNCSLWPRGFWLIWKDARFGSSKSYYIFQNLRIICLC